MWLGIGIPLTLDLTETLLVCNEQHYNEVVSIVTHECTDIIVPGPVEICTS